MQLSLSDLVLASALPVLEVVMMCLVGAVLVWKGVMKPEGRAFITKLMYFIFFPALVVTSLGTSVTLETLKSWWPVPVSTLLNVVLGAILGYITFPFVGMEPHLKPHFVSCAMAGNLGNLLMVLVPSIAAKASVFTDEDGKDGLAYVFTGLFAICIAVFTIVNFLLELPEQQALDPPPPDNHTTQSSPVSSCYLQARSDRDIQLSNTLDKPTEVGYAAVGAADHEDPAVSPILSHRISDPQSSGSEDKLQMITAGTEGPQESIVVHMQSTLACDASPTAEASRSNTKLPTEQYQQERVDDASMIPSKSTRAAQPVAESRLKAPSHSPDVRWRRGPCPCSYHDIDPDIAAIRANRAHNCLPAGQCSDGNSISGYIWACRTQDQGKEEEDIIRRLSSRGGVAVGEGLSQPNSPTAIMAHDGGDMPAKHRSKPAVINTESRQEHQQRQQQNKGTVSSKWKVLSWKILKGLVNVPTISITLGLIVACTTPLRRLFYGPDDGENEENDDERGELEVITSALSRLGGAAIPCMMIAIGGALSKGPGGSKVSWRAVVALILIRLVVLPALGGWAVIAADEARLWKDNGQMFTLVLALQQAMPTALNVHTMASVNKNNEEVVASLLFWQYLACIVTIPVCVLVYLSKITGS